MGNGDCMSEFKVGDKVKWVRDWSKLKLYTEYIGKEYTIDEIDVFCLELNKIVKRMR